MNELSKIETAAIAVMIDGHTWFYPIKVTSEKDNKALLNFLRHKGGICLELEGEVDIKIKQP